MAPTFRVISTRALSQLRAHSKFQNHQNKTDKSEIWKKTCQNNVWYIKVIIFRFRLMTEVSNKLFQSNQVFLDKSRNKKSKSEVAQVWKFSALDFYRFYNFAETKGSKFRSKFHKEFMKSSFLPRYEPNIVRISALLCATHKSQFTSDFCT